MIITCTGKIGRTEIWKLTSDYPDDEIYLGRSAFRELFHHKRRHDMAVLLRRVLPLIALVVAAPLVRAEDQADNPFFKLWSKSKPGDTVVLKETTKLSG